MVPSYLERLPAFEAATKAVMGSISEAVKLRQPILNRPADAATLATMHTLFRIEDLLMKQNELLRAIERKLPGERS